MMLIMMTMKTEKVYENDHQYISCFVDFAQDDDIVNDLMREIDNVQIGIYTSLKETSQVGFNTLLEISADMEARGWKHIVRSIDNGELLAAYISSDIKKTFTQM